MARVSFEDRKSVPGAIVGIVLFLAIGYLVWLGLTKIGMVGQRQFFLRLGLTEAIAFGLATVIVGRRLANYSWDDLGWHQPALRRWLQGTIVGVATAAVAVVLALIAGTRFIVTHEWRALLVQLVPLALGFALIALGSQLTYRGYPLRRLADAIGVVPATLTIALLVGLLESRGSFATFFSFLNAVLGTIWLSVAFFSAGGLPLAWGAHFGWTAVLTLLNASATAFVIQVPGVVHLASSNRWIDGGLNGLEGGIVATLALFASTLYLRGLKGAFPAPEPAAARPVATRSPR